MRRDTVDLFFPEIEQGLYHPAMERIPIGLNLGSTACSPVPAPRLLLDQDGGGDTTIDTTGTPHELIVLGTIGLAALIALTGYCIMPYNRR